MKHSVELFLTELPSYLVRSAEFYFPARKKSIRLSLPSDRSVSAPTNGVAAPHSARTFSSKVPGSRIPRDTARLCEFKVSVRSHLSSLFLWFIDIYRVQPALLGLLMDLLEWQLAVRGLRASAVSNPHPKNGHS